MASPSPREGRAPSRALWPSAFVKPGGRYVSAVRWRGFSFAAGGRLGSCSPTAPRSRPRWCWPMSRRRAWSSSWWARSICRRGWSRRCRASSRAGAPSSWTGPSMGRCPGSLRRRASPTSSTWAATSTTWRVSPSRSGPAACRRFLISSSASNRCPIPRAPRRASTSCMPIPTSRPCPRRGVGATIAELFARPHRNPIEAHAPGFRSLIRARHLSAPTRSRGPERAT